MPIDETSDPRDVYLSELDGTILTAIVAHPYRLPTPREIRFVASGHEAEAVQRRVRRLVEQDLIVVVQFESRPPAPEHPDRFLGLTEFGRTVLEQRLSPEKERELQANYARLEKPEEIRRLERAPRPPR